MSASATDNFMEVALAGSETTLASPGHSIGGSSINITSASGWPTSTGIIFAMRRVDSNGNFVAGTYTEWAGVLSGVAISGLTLLYGSDQNYAADGLTQVYIPISKFLWNRLVDTILAQHTQAGAHTGLTTDTLVTSGAATIASLLPQAWDGWVNDTHTWVYVSATSFKVTGVDVTALFPAGTKIKLKQGGVPAYFYVTSATFSTDTTVNITAGSDYSLSNTAITSPGYSYATTPQGFPAEFNWTPSWTNVGVGNGTLSAKYTMIGKIIYGRLMLVYGSSTSITGPTEFTPPVTLHSDYTLLGEIIVGNGTATDTNDAIYPAVVKVITTSLLTIAAFSTVSGSNPVGVGASSGQDITNSFPFAAAPGDGFTATFIYEVA